MLMDHFSRVLRSVRDKSPGNSLAMGESALDNRRRSILAERIKCGWMESCPPTRGVLP